MEKIMAAAGASTQHATAEHRADKIGGLIAPLTLNELSALWLSPTLKHARRRPDDRPTTLLGWDSLLEKIKSGIIPFEALRVTYRGHDVPKHFYSENGILNPERFTHLFEQGASLIVLKLQTYEPAIEAARQEARMHGIAMPGAGFIVTTGTGGALKLHRDPQDLVIVQVEGSKRWQIHGPSVSECRPGIADDSPPEGAPLFDDFLMAGDVLFLPGGYWHKCENGPGRSLHVMLFLDRPASDKKSLAFGEPAVDKGLP
jgi:hypothetical protein